jgi:hypothetical protein
VVLHKPNGEAAARVTSFVEPDALLAPMHKAREL